MNDITIIQTIIVFPKYFEFLKFNEVIRTVAINPCNEFYEVSFFNGDECKSFHVLIMELSDIMFTIKLSSLMKSYNKSKWMLIGSCGQDKKIGDLTPKSVASYKDIHEVESVIKLGETFWVNSAIKFDRGTLLSDKSDPTKLVFTLSDELKVEHKLSGLLIGESKVVYSSNYLTLTNKMDNKYYDMESYDFIKMCQQFGVNLIGVIRCVTDVTSFKFNKLMRMCSSFMELGIFFEKNAKYICSNVDFIIPIGWSVKKNPQTIINNMISYTKSDQHTILLNLIDRYIKKIRETSEWPDHKKIFDDFVGFKGVILVKPIAINGTSIEVLKQMISYNMTMNNLYEVSVGDDLGFSIYESD